MNSINKDSIAVCQERARRCYYYKNIVKRHLNDIKRSIQNSKNSMEENYYRGRYAVQLSAYSKALNVQEKYLERCICPPPQTLIHKNQE